MVIRWISKVAFFGFVSLVSVFAGQAVAFSSEAIRALKAERSTHITKLGNDPVREDGLVYAYWGLRGKIVKIGTGNDFGKKYTLRNEAVRKSNPKLNFDMSTRCVVRGLTRGEAWTVEAMMHLHYEDAWVVQDFNSGIFTSEAFSVVNRKEVCSLMAVYSNAVRIIRADDDKERMSTYHRKFESAVAGEADDVTDWNEARESTKLTQPEKFSLEKTTMAAQSDRKPPAPFVVSDPNVPNVDYKIGKMPNLGGVRGALEGLDSSKMYYKASAVSDISNASPRTGRGSVVPEIPKRKSRVVVEALSRFFRNGATQ